MSGLSCALMARDFVEDALAAVNSRDWTYEDFAEAVPTSSVTISEWFRRKRKPRLDKAQRACEVLGLNPDDYPGQFSKHGERRRRYRVTPPLDETVTSVDTGRSASERDTTTGAVSEGSATSMADDVNLTSIRGNWPLLSDQQREHYARLIARAAGRGGSPPGTHRRAKHAVARRG